jgi:hypothetical protein
MRPVSTGANLCFFSLYFHSYFLARSKQKVHGAIAFGMHRILLIVPKVIRRELTRRGVLPRFILNSPS